MAERGKYFLANIILAVTLYLALRLAKLWYSVYEREHVYIPKSICTHFGWHRLNFKII